MTTHADQPDRVVMSRLSRLGDDDGSFDLEFWQRAGSARRLEAAWDAVVDLARWGKLDEDQLRLQRSVERIIRGKDALPGGGGVRGDALRDP